MIESVNNQKIKEYSKLKDKKYRDKEKLFIVEGEHLVKEAIKRGLVKEIFSTKVYENATLVSENVMKKLSNLTSPPEILAVVKMLDERKINGNILILDGIQDPGNLGTIIRSAVAFNIDTIVSSFDTVDLYNIKTIRGTEGMLFNINYLKRDLSSFINDIKSTHHIYTTDVNDGINISSIKVKRPYALIMGNEGKGVSVKIASLSDDKINISINHECESLNVAIATSIILYEFNKE